MRPHYAGRMLHRVLFFVAMAEIVRAQTALDDPAKVSAHECYQSMEQCASRRPTEFVRKVCVCVCVIKEDFYKITNVRTLTISAFSANEHQILCGWNLSPSTFHICLYVEKMLQSLVKFSHPPRLKIKHGHV